MPRDKQQIIDLETRFWQSMVDGDVKLAQTMIADECLLTGPKGSMRIDPDKYAAMADEGQWNLESFRLKNMDVVFPSDDTAVVAYNVRQKGDMQGKPMDLNCADSSTWVRQGGAWKCALHTETILQG